jgi:hypothetical protein
VAAATIAARTTLAPMAPPKGAGGTAAFGVPGGPAGSAPGGGTAIFPVPGTPASANAPATAGTGAAAGVDPVAAGLASGPLAGSATPADPGALPGMLLPGLLLLALLTAAGVPLLGRLRRAGGEAP